MTWHNEFIWALVGAMAVYEALAVASQSSSRWSWPTITEMVRSGTATWGEIVRAVTAVLMVLFAVLLAGHFLYGWW